MGVQQSLSRYDLITIKVSLFNLALQGSDKIEIGVSKFCCPACSALLAFLGGESNKITVRGCHNTLFVTDLPRWLPDGVIQHMINTFQPYLREALHTLYKHSQSGTIVLHTNDTSIQSEASDTSIHSTNNHPDISGHPLQ